MDRAFPRAPYAGAITYFEWGKPREAVAAGIGGNGVFLRTPEILPVGSFVTVRLALPGAAKPFTVLGKVVRVVRGGTGLTPNGIGVEFVDMAANQRKGVLDYIASRGEAAA